MSSLPSERIVLWACALLSAFQVSLGGLSMGLHIPVVLVAAAMAIVQRGVMLRHAATVTLLVAAMVGHFTLIQFTTPCTDMLAKSAISLAVAMLVLLALFQLAQGSATRSLLPDMRLIVGIVIASLAFDAFRAPAADLNQAIRASGFFAEPSHLALAMTPPLVGLVRSHLRADRIGGWTAFVAMSLLSASATLFMMFVLSLVVAIIAEAAQGASIVRVLRVAVGAGIMTLLVVASPYSSEIADRATSLFQIDTSANLSSVVYVNGWETAVSNAVSTNGVGLGFNRMGCNPRPDTASGEVLEFFDIGETNYNDGSFTFAKLLSELGFFGVALWVLMAALLWRIVQQHRANGMRMNSARALFLSAATVMVIGALIRGTNYFSGSFLLGIYGLFIGFAPAPMTPKAATRETRPVQGKA
jgi:hypothetical protein